MDILSAVGYALKREVPKKDLDKDDIVALQHWVTLLTKVNFYCSIGKKFLNTLHLLIGSSSKAKQIICRIILKSDIMADK